MPAPAKPIPLGPDGLPLHGYVRLQQILAILPVSRSTLYYWVANGKLPPPIKITPRVAAWPVEVIRELLGHSTKTIASNTAAAIASKARKRVEAKAEAERQARKAELLGVV